MSTQPPALHMVCGKIASGKSTLTAALGRAAGTVVISEDDWLKALFAEEMTSVRDYMRCAGRLQGIMGPHVVALLRAGGSVVLGFQANTPEARNWMRGLLETAGAEHVLHVLEVPDAICLQRLRARNALGRHPFAVSEEQFHQISRHVVRPSADEAFTLRVHG